MRIVRHAGEGDRAYGSSSRRKPGPGGAAIWIPPRITVLRRDDAGMTAP